MTEKKTRLLATVRPKKQTVQKNQDTISKQPLISIIIPALNEEKYIEQLLKSIKKQTYANYEIIVADAGSKDKTIEIAKKYGAKVVKGGIPSVGRNAGAKVAKGKILLFLDADSLLVDKNFLSSLLEDFKPKEIELVILKFKNTILPFEDFGKYRNFWAKIGSTVENFYRSIEYALNTMILGCGVMAVKKEVFWRVGGYNPTIKYGEDNDFLLRVIKSRPRNVKKNYTFSNKKILISARRFTDPKVILSGWLLAILFAFAEIFGIFGAYKIRAQIRNFLMKLFYGELGGKA